MNNYFVSVFVADEDINIPEFHVRNLMSTLNDIEINPTLVAKAIGKLNPTKSPGPDNLHPKLIVETKDTIKYPLAKIFEQSLQERDLPTD